MVAQKTALAAALLTDPEVLLLDEPLRSLDPDERPRLLLLKPRRRTVVIASRYPASEAGLVNQVALHPRRAVVLHANVAELRRTGCRSPLRGIEALADRHGIAARAPTSTGVTSRVTASP